MSLSILIETASTEVFAEKMVSLMIYETVKWNVAEAWLLFVRSPLLSIIWLLLVINTAVAADGACASGAAVNDNDEDDDFEFASLVEQLAPYKMSEKIPNGTI